MKRTIKWALIAGLIMVVSSCKKFLDEQSITKLDENKVYADLDLVETSLKGIYANWKAVRTDEQGTIMMMGTDEIQQGAYQMKSDAQKGGLDRYDANLNSTLTYNANQWNIRWPLVNEAAKIIRGLGKDSLTAGTKEASLYGEACFVRGFVDFELAMYWGEIPIRDLDREAELGDRRQPLNDVWKFILDDLTKAATYCPTTNDPGRATLGAAWAMLGKAYMAAPVSTGLRDFTKASQCFEKMMSNYSLVPYKDLWDYSKANSAEAILEFQFGPVSPNNNKIQFQIGSRAVQSFFGDGCYYSGYDKIVPTVHAYETVANGGVWEDGDLRKDESIRYDFTYYGVTPTLQNLTWEDLGNDYDELMPHIKKYEDFRTDSHSDEKINNMWNSGKNIPILRLGDIKLCYAECLNEIGKTPDAVNVVNEVRTRAWGGVLPEDKKWKTMSQDAFRTNIMEERIRELFAEDWRRIDLIRTGKFVELVKARNKWTKQSGTIQDYNTIFPIPDTEMKLNSDIGPEDQNPGYN
ncbi:Starch-binding associating with outer membrane [Chitinophaga costaii]|uniref:Starch-binding associating with outer membrane n=1 Tax=Chitinophaga costaii TaxID=1335309 RepID=A0A1C4D0Y0_9BACT|nr:RagB/SusD family nutrient uptake outer membrane protein [Chitinophaga costaii]PUZ24669.1 RagB/SusD family nutrient uptake outer membrane protein [Chitinophaga costaii]SCC24900.1 Starch-binding associating with outer membrane [Chitinophaga costaii]